MVDVEKEMNELDHSAPLQGLEPIESTPVAPAVGVAAVALNMAMKYHDISTIKDGAMYQAYKLEGRNLRELQLDMVLETAIKLEAFLLGASDRIAKVIVDALEAHLNQTQRSETELKP